MKTYLDCVPCFFRQALEAARTAGANQKTQNLILNEIARMLPEFPLGSPPPLIGRIVHGLVKTITQKDDPYAEIKAKSNTYAINFYSTLKKKVSASSDRLLMALELAIAGNIVDYGVKNSLDIEKELKKILNKEEITIKEENKKNFTYKHFRYMLNKSNTILYLADNAGETIFDRIFIEEIKKFYKNRKIIYAVKEKPIINDALIEDAYKCGIHKTAEIISCGSDAPGTVLSLCSKEFLKLYRRADMVISKGQGNYEALSGEKKIIFFLLMAKCTPVAQNVGCNIGDIIFFHNISGI
jgi:uncharacterized protein with ATP-grasp and redox domains